MSGIKGIVGSKSTPQKKERTSPKPQLKRVRGRRGGVKYKDLSASKLSPLDRQIKNFETRHGFKVGEDFTKEEFMSFSGENRDVNTETLGRLFAQYKVVLLKWSYLFGQQFGISKLQIC